MNERQERRTLGERSSPLERLTGRVLSPSDRAARRPLSDAWPAGDADDAPRVDLADALATLRRRLPTLLLTTLLVAGLFTLFTSRSPATYSATAEVLVGRPLAELIDGAQAAPGADAERALQNERRIASGSGVLATATAQLGTEPDVDVTAVAGSDILRITARSDSAAGAADAANAVVRAYTADRQDQLAKAAAASEASLARLTAATPAASAQIDRLQATVTRLQLALADERTSGTLVVRTATAAADPTGANRAQNVVLGLLIGGVIGVAAALLREHLDDSVRSVGKLAAATALPNGGVIVGRRSLVSGRQDRTFNELLLLLATRGFGDRSRSLAVIGVAPRGRGDGLSAAVAGVARAVAATGTSVAVASLRGDRSQLERHLPLVDDAVSGQRHSPTDGYLASSAAIGPQLRAVEGWPNLQVLPRPDRAAMIRLAGPARLALLDELTKGAEIVLIEAGLVDAQGRGATSALLVDTSLLVVHARTPRAQVRSVIKSLASLGVTPLATVLVVGRGSSMRRWAGLFAEAEPIAAPQDSPTGDESEGQLRVVQGGRT